MNIFLLVDDDFPSTKAAPLMMRQLALEFKRKGHNVTLVAPSANVKKRYETEIWEGVKIVHFYSPPLKNVNRILRAIRETLLSFRLLLAGGVFEMKTESVLIYFSPSIFFGPAVFYLKWKLKCKSYLVLRDIFPQWAVDSGLISRYSPVYWYFKLFEYLNYKAADAIGVQTAQSLEYFNGYPAKLASRKVLFSWFDNSAPVYSGSGLRERYGLEDKVIYFFGGNIGHAQDIMNVFRLAKAMQAYEKAFFLLVGKGDEFDMLAAQIRLHGMTNILLLPQVSQTEYFEILSQADVGLFSLHSRHLTQNIPGKTFGYMAYSKPILGSINSGNDLLRIVAENEVGLVSVNPDDAAFCNNALKLLNSEEIRLKYGQNGRKLIETVFSVSRAAENILKTLAV